MRYRAVRLPVQPALYSAGWCSIFFSTQHGDGGGLEKQHNYNRVKGYYRQLMTIFLLLPLVSTNRKGA